MSCDWLAVEQDTYILLSHQLPRRSYLELLAVPAVPAIPALKYSDYS